MKVFKIIKYVFTATGLGMLIGALMAYNSTVSFLDNAVSVEGTVIDLEQSRSDGSTAYKPVVEFVDKEGQRVEFISSVGSSPPSYSIGEKVGVLYAPENSQHARLNSFFEVWGLVLIFATMGVPFFCVGALTFLIGMFQNRKKVYLQRDGIVINAKFQSVQLNRSLSVNGRHPYMIVCQWTNPANYCIHIFESENIWFDPSDFITTEEIKVFTHKRNPKKYYVDVSFLPKVAR